MSLASNPDAPSADALPQLVCVDATRQILSIHCDGAPTITCRVSTAGAGLGQEQGSGKTPTGWHRIAQIIGLEAPLGTQFVSREPTGTVWAGEVVEEDWILTRIFWLEGLEPGWNQGQGLDSFARYIYIHGTNREDLLGQPTSHGCVRVSNSDAMALSQILHVGDLVFIGPRELS